MYLATPRILYMRTNTNNEQVIPFVFKILPTQLCHSHLIEHYILQWMDINTLNPVKINKKY